MERSIHAEAHIGHEDWMDKVGTVGQPGQWVEQTTREKCVNVSCKYILLREEIANK